MRDKLLNQHSIDINFNIALDCIMGVQFARIVQCYMSLLLSSLWSSSTDEGDEDEEIRSMEEDNNDNELGGGGGRRRWRRKNTATVFNNRRDRGRSVPIEAPRDRHDEDRSRRPHGPNDEDDDNHDDGGLSASKSAIGAARVSLLDAC